MLFRYFTALLAFVSFAYISSGKESDSAFQEKSFDMRSVKNLEYFYEIADGKRIIFLGEEDHKISEFNQLKTQIVSSYKEKNERVVLLFESYIDAAFLGFRNGAANFQWADSTPKIMPIWDNTENLDLLKEPAEGHSFLIGGIDPQDNSSVFYKTYQQTPFYKHFKTNHFWNDSLNNRLLYLDSIRFVLQRQRSIVLDENWKAKDSSSSAFQNFISDCNRLLLDYGQLVKRLPQGHTANEQIDRVLVQNLPWDIEVSLNPLIYDALRNKMMAANLNYLADSVFAGWKIIVWAHDLHVMKRDQDERVKQSICVYLPKSVMDQSTVFLFNTNCHIKNNGERIEKMGIASSATIHQYLAAGNESCFFSYLTDKSLWSKQFKRYYWERYTHACHYRPAELCDGIFYIKDTHTSHFLDKYMHE
ncbi:erythromycin esterase family protein [Taibaiella soli]|uniref:Erythromycin esterase family protein n=1 Tax=Taibaiella soli TaxID=1649169 RepID=A0A2W2AFY1_9BACT|nr:erythromycin esterase family protein [Taibaiella soli]PZF74425.1 hypothetical protein DN068_02270 [Taibaiella soli]